MTKKQELSPFMLEAIALAKEGGGKLARLQGGYWCIEGEERKPNNGVPVRYAIAVTVQGLIYRGYATYTKYQVSKKRANFPIEMTLTEKAS